MPRSSKPTVVSQDVYLLLIEYIDNGILRRSWIPKGIKVNLTEARRGIQVGVHMSDIEKLLKTQLKTLCGRIEHGLHRRGLYTSADVERSPEPGRLVEAAVKEALKPLTGQIVELLRQEE